LFCLPYNWAVGNPEKNTLLLNHLAEHPLWFSVAMSPEEARVNAAYFATSNEYWKWEVWSAGTLCGMLLLSRVIPKCDALFHFTLFPASQTGVTLFSARRLLWNFLGYAFDAFDLQRISAEVPEHSPKLVHYLRQRLGFRYEGETDIARLQKNKGVVKFDVPGAPTWIAAQGSRRDNAHWDGSKWSDLILLRLLRSEYQTRVSLGVLPQATAETSTTEISREPWSKASQIPTDAPAGSAAGVPEGAV